ncbi:MAG: AAA family ATPase [Solirubrobacterales bacterium]|nr:AAA family ATPase [Solirubrobacterales bacterium]
MPPAGPARERTRIQLCGRLSIEVDGAELIDGLRGKQVPLLLAYLVLNRERQVSREELIEALWPERMPVSQDGALRTLLSRLRSGLGASVLVGRDELMLSLVEPVWVDVEAALAEMERAHEALEQGEARVAWALAQVPLNIARRGLLPGSQADWLEPRRRELEEVKLQALEAIGRAGLKLGGTLLGSVERSARALIEAEPYRESGYALLMQALAARGNVAEGLRVYERLRTLLREELGTAPSPETIAVHELLLTPSRRPEPEAGGRAGGPLAIELPAELRVSGRTPLVGRIDELEGLARLWTIAAGADPGEPVGLGGPVEIVGPLGASPSVARVVLLAGDPGIGKTRLLVEVARRVHDAGALVLAGRSPEQALVAYQPFLEALRHYIVNVPAGQLQASAREYGSELSRLIPELRRRVPDLPPPTPGEPEMERYRLFEAVVGLLAECASSAPVLLVLDDLHWADRPTLLLLRHLARARGAGRLLILGAYRATEMGAGFAAALMELRHERLVTQINVTGLERDETAELVHLRTGEVPSASFSDALHEETGGNPLFIEEIVRHLAEAGVRAGRAGAGELQGAGLPEGVKEVIARRLTRLDESVIEWLRVAAVIGRDFESTLLEEVLSAPEEEYFVALEEALDDGLVVEAGASPGSYSFSHALIRETLYEGMSRPRRARIHRRVGAALEASDPDRHLSALAHHYTRAAGPQDAERAIRYAMRAGEQAIAMLAHEEAAEHYARALEVLERFEPDALTRRLELLLALGEAQVRSGERPLAQQTFREAAGLAARLGDSASLARAAIGASRRYVQPPGVVDEELIGRLEQALEMMGGERSVVRVALLARLCGAIYFSPERERMKALSEEATVLAQELDDPQARALAAAARRRAFWAPDELQRRLADSTELLRQAREAGNVELELQGHAWLMVDLLEQGDMEAVEAQMEAFSAGAQRLRQPLYLWHAGVWEAMRALLSGQLERADDLALRALGTGVHGEGVTAPQYYALELLAIRREQRRMGELEQRVREAVQESPHRPAWGAALLTLLWEQERTDEARLQLDRLAASEFRDIPADGDWLPTIALLAEGASELRDAARAATLYRLLRGYEQRNVVVGLGALCLGSVARYLGRLAATLGEIEQAERHFERALAAHQRLRAPVYVAHTQLDWAGALGPGERAAELLTAAAAIAEGLGLRSVAFRAAKLRDQGPG